MTMEMGNGQVGATPGVASRTAGWARSLAVATAVVFFLSCLFPAVAGFVTDTTSVFALWWGRADVALALILAGMVLGVSAIAESKVDREAENRAYHAYRVLIHCVLAVLVIFFLAGNRIIWAQCLTGFAWRFWLLFYILPAWFRALRRA